MINKGKTMNTNQFLTNLEKMLKEKNLETYITDSGDPLAGNILRTLLPVTETGDMVMTEFMAASYTDDADLIQIYSTMIMKIGPGYEAMKEMILDWNLTCPLGAFGIYRQERQFYHKYTFLQPKDADPEETAEEVFDQTGIILDILREYFPDAVRLSGHA